MPTFLQGHGLGGFFGQSSLHLSVVCFLTLLLAFSLQHSVRLSNQVERLHWQLALSQLLRTTGVPGRVSDPTGSLVGQLTEKGTEKQLEELLRLLKDIVKTQTKEAETPSSCPNPLDAETDESLTLPYLRLAVGATLVVFIAAGVAVWRNPDRLTEYLPKSVIQYIEQNENPRPISQVLAYRLDLWFSTHKHAKVLALLFLTLMLVVVGSLALFSVGTISLYDAFWSSLAGVGIDWTFAQDLTLSSGIVAIVGRIVSMMISLGGLLVTALLLGIVSETISEKVDDMKKGTSEVLESDHTLILGWSDEMVPIIRQICLANESIGGSPIVILAEREKEEIEGEIMRNDINFHGSKVICRSGNPLLKHDLDKVSVHSARSIIVLANQQSPDQSDARVLRIILSLVAFNEQGGLKGYVVAELCDMDNEPLIKMVGGDLVQTVVSHDIIGRLMIQCAIQPGLASVYDELMGFEGCEFYFQRWPQLTGKRFGEVLVSFADAVPLGIKEGATGTIRLNIASEYILKENDEVLVVAEDENTYQPTPPAATEAGQCPEETIRRNIEKILFLGWRRDMDDMISVLDTLVAKGTELWLYNEVPIDQRQKMLIQGGLDPETDLENLQLKYTDPGLEGDLITRKKLQSLEPASFTSILVLADDAANGDNIADADSRNLATLLLLRDIMQKQSGAIAHRSSSGTHLRALSRDESVSVIVSEILDARTRHLIMQLDISEFVMSNEIVSMALAMVAESADVNNVLQELFSERGSELYVRPACYYIRPDETLSFYELLVRSRQRHEIAIGYRRSVLERGGTEINPVNKKERCLTLQNIESVVVLAE